MQYRLALLRKQWVAAACSVGLLVGALASPVWAAQTRTFTFGDVQVTATPTGIADELTLDSYGSTIAFVSTANITGANSDGNPEIYAAHVFFGFTITPVQVTNTPAGVVNAHPQLNSDGTVLIFQSTGNLDPSVGNSDGSSETFSIDWAIAGAPFKQLTFNQAGAAPLATPNPANRVSSASSNSDGSLIVFASRSSQIPGTNNSDSNSEIFLYDRTDDFYYQVTSTSGTAGNLHPMIDDEGTSISYLTNQDGNYEVHVVEVTEDFIDVDPCIADPDLCSNQPPTISITPAGDQSVDEGQVLTLRIVVTDPEEDYVSLKLVQANGSPLPSGAAIVLDSATCDPEFDDCRCNPATDFCSLPSQLHATFTWRTNSTQGGRDYQLLFKAMDDFTDTEITQLVNVTVVNANQPPAGLPANLGARTVTVGHVMAPISYSASDVDCNTLSASVGGLPSGAVASSPVFTPCPATAINASSRISGQLAWTPQPGQEGVYTITVSVSDGIASVSGVATVTVVTNRAPLITSADATTYERACLMYIVRGQDPDGDPVEFDIDPSTLPPGAVFYRGTSTLHWHPDTSVAAPGVPGRFTVRVKANDGIVTTEKDIRITVYDTPDDQSQFFNTSMMAINTTPGASLSVSLMLKNSGYATWGSAYTLVPDFVSAGMTAPGPVALPVSSLIPGSYVTFSIPMNAPTALGSYTLRFKMADNGQKFGASSGNVIIIVR